MSETLIDTEEKLSALQNGSYVVCSRNGSKFEGVVLFQWRCLDEIAVNVRTASGEQVSALPLLGDEVRVTRTPEEQAMRDGKWIPPLADDDAKAAGGVRVGRVGVNE